MLALAFLAQDQGLADFRTWGYDWFSALQYIFTDEYQSLAFRARMGLKALMESEEDFEEAYHTCANGLLAQLEVETEDLREVGERLLGEAINQLEGLAG